LDKINIHRVLVSPLDWGLGHATRCISIIQAFQNLQIEVIIAADGAVANLLYTEFPHIKIIPIQGYQIQYAKTPAGLFWKLLYQLPKILQRIRREHVWLQHIIQSEKIDLVISDNRFGLYSNKVPCIFITHQLTIKAPIFFIEKLLQKINYYFINRFSACWVPDSAGAKNVAGVLSHPTLLPKIPVHYIGILTRLISNSNASTLYQYCFLLSGPEPQRTLLEDQIKAILPKLSGSIAIVRGLPGTQNALDVAEHVTAFNHLPTEQLSKVLCSSNLIICRSGYTTVMELIALQKNALLIPTPGQTEQEYLAEKLQKDQRFFSIAQDRLNLLQAIKEAEDYTPACSEISHFSINRLEALLLEI
jgi:uncharacterized protein (TIGR00661 family)